jgi:hypothetical protein
MQNFQDQTDRVDGRTLTDGGAFFVHQKSPAGNVSLLLIQIFKAIGKQIINVITLRQTIFLTIISKL